MNRHTDLADEATRIVFREFETCSCGVRLAPLTGPIHDYMLSTPSCWHAFGSLLAREYEDPARWSVHRHSVDAYAVQHPGIDSAQARNSIGIHLSRLYFLFARGWPTDRVDRIMPQIIKKKMEYPWLKPPSVVAHVNIGHVLQSETAADHRARVLLWAESSWAQWVEYHSQVQEWWRNVP